MKPEANIESIVDTTNSDITKRTKEDVCIIWGGTRDVAKKGTEVGLRLLKKCVARHQHTNLIVMRVCHRYDLAMESSVNSEIKVF
jgi:predicted nuclease with TOPRIM domain